MAYFGFTNKLLAGETIKIFKSYVGENNGDWLLDEIEDSLKIYFLFENLQKAETTTVKHIIDYIFENVVLYYDPHFIKNYQKFHYEKKSEFWNTAKALDGLTGYYIEHHYTMQAMVKDLEMETGLNMDLCVYMGELIQKNYHLLQLNHIIDALHVK